MKNRKKHKQVYLEVEEYKRTYFGKLEVGERFLWGGKEHYKMLDVGTGPIMGGFLGVVNAIQVGTAQLSGMGPLVEVTRFM